ncbi:uncharacterized protein B0I36DRAFT_320150 [Microdochium trichocladiopsis]|uniref:Uncharacterized protein n=1 Tax=Microdochium trichocladiopsis TaxID=1682393 RepID=A0A9P8YAX2_9PEZI|nr:uncharacterized protein B0I36DRAFT_320150 [Microdochium trichocladiopsis]KAH7032842.1 hypothetical protein B0I36DRAFT_320150 [Microdochium trichocladiopsis]
MPSPKHLHSGRLLFVAGSRPPSIRTASLAAGVSHQQPCASCSARPARYAACLPVAASPLQTDGRGDG